MDYFFDVPVYRLTKEKYEAEQKVAVESDLFATEFLQEFYSKNPEQESSMRHRLMMSYGGAWQFNEIIGHIRLHFYGTQVRGEWWKIEAKRITRTRKKIFVWRHWKVVYEEEIPEESTNEEIFKLILCYLKRAQDDDELRRFYVDTSVFERIGRHVNWKEAFLTLNGFNRAGDT